MSNSRSSSHTCLRPSGPGFKDEDFIAATLTDDVPERKVLYEDPELGFCIPFGAEVLPLLQRRGELDCDS